MTSPQPTIQPNVQTDIETDVSTNIQPPQQPPQPQSPNPLSSTPSPLPFLIQSSTQSTQILTFPEYLFYQGEPDVVYELFRGRLIPIPTLTSLHQSNSCPSDRGRSHEGREAKSRKGSSPRTPTDRTGTSTSGAGRTTTCPPPSSAAGAGN